MIKVLSIIGTRPEAIKMAPVIIELKKHADLFETKVCATAQHREMLDQVLSIFQITPDYDLDIMTEGQDLFEVTTRIMSGLGYILVQEKPDVALIQGDTTTSFVGSLAAYYLQIPIGHIEAGLRTHNKYSPFPEEKNRHLTSVLADYHFAPTEWAKSNLLRENVPEDRIWVTGNTVIDALLHILRFQKEKEAEKYWAKYFFNNFALDISENNRKVILITGHRRESFGEAFKNICHALKEIAQRNPEVTLVYPVHLNPNVRKPVYDILGPLSKDTVAKKKSTGAGNIFLIDPLDYAPFVFLMNKAHVILTDSGGVQEEAPSLGKPVLVMRNTTERPEGIDAGTVELVGTNKATIVERTQNLLDDNGLYERMSKAVNPYGDGKAAERITDILISHLRDLKTSNVPD